MGGGGGGWGGGGGGGGGEAKGGVKIISFPSSSRTSVRPEGNEPSR